ncbi:hypothetical protein QOL99_02310 [Deinococcus sp. MIMF12]|uniref:Uncharacterized protein n=1 Tax=Deinococcus rhizophilus TaxID=3049544 RepID=A0ABT7JEI9_9DEIO|nr:hypothetical protein [Deinococcus rhizophilus]MDL2342977.1 hypothetical protein [Deinococcus rhizophilus]
MSGELVDQLARRFYDVEILKKMHGSFSTLGGKKKGQGTRLTRQESVNSSSSCGPGKAHWR